MRITLLTPESATTTAALVATDVEVPPDARLGDLREDFARITGHQGWTTPGARLAVDHVADLYEHGPAAGPVPIRILDSSSDREIAPDREVAVKVADGDDPRCLGLRRRRGCKRRDRRDERGRHDLSTHHRSSCYADADSSSKATLVTRSMSGP